MANTSFVDNSSIRLELDFGKVTKEMEDRKNRAVSLVTSQFFRLCQPYVRFDTGMMAHTAFSASDFKAGLLVWDTPYASIAYWNDVNTVNTSHNPNATARWAEVAFARNHKALQALVAKTMKGD